MCVQTSSDRNIKSNVAAIIFLDLSFQEKHRHWTIGLGEIYLEILNIKIETRTLSFGCKIEF